MKIRHKLTKKYRPNKVIIFLELKVYANFKETKTKSWYIYKKQKHIKP